MRFTLHGTTENGKFVAKPLGYAEELLAAALGGLSPELFEAKPVITGDLYESTVFEINVWPYAFEGPNIIEMIVNNTSLRQALRQALREWDAQHPDEAY